MEQKGRRIEDHVSLIPMVVLIVHKRKGAIALILGVRVHTDILC